jgi:hypothetical protein
MACNPQDPFYKDLKILVPAPVCIKFYRITKPFDCLTQLNEILDSVGSPARYYHTVQEPFAVLKKIIQAIAFNGGRAFSAAPYKRGIMAVRAVKINTLT